MKRLSAGFYTVATVELFLKNRFHADYRCLLLYLCNAGLLTSYRTRFDSYFQHWTKREEVGRRANEMN